MGMANDLKNILEYNFSYLCIFMNLPKVEYFEEGTRNSRKVVKKMASAFEAAACHLGANVAFSGPAQCMVPCVHNECGSIFFHCYRCQSSSRTQLYSRAVGQYVSVEVIPLTMTQLSKSIKSGLDNMGRMSLQCLVHQKIE